MRGYELVLTLLRLRLLLLICRLGQPKAALKAAALGCSACPASAPVWTHRLQLELELRSKHKVRLLLFVCDT